MKKIALILFYVVTIVGCKMGKNYKGTDVIVPDKFAQKDTSLAVISDTVNTDTLNVPQISDLNWWEITQDNVLDSLIDKAMKNNKNALIAAENILQARYALKIQNAEFLPKFSMGISAQRGNFLNNQIGAETDIFMGAGNLNWELDLWGKLRRLSEASRAQLVATEYGYRGIMISLISEVATNYYNLLRVQSQLEISKRVAASRDSMLIIIEARYNKGIVPMIDVNQAEIQLAIAQGAVPRYQRELVNYQNALQFLLGENPGPIQTGKPLEEQNYNIEIPSKAPVDLLAQRPDVIAAEYQLIGQNARVGAAQANRLPTLSVSALLGIASNDFSTLSFSNPLWNLGGQLAGPLFYWGQLKRAADIEQSKRFQSLFAYENTVLFALTEVENTLVEINTLKLEIEISERRKASAINALTLSSQRYDKGVTSYLEYLEQQRQAFDAELILEGKRADYLSAQIKLYKALGGGWLNTDEKNAANNAN